MPSYCSCGHTVAEYLAGGQCRATEDGQRCTCQSVDVDEAE